MSNFNLLLVTVFFTIVTSHSSFAQTPIITENFDNCEMAYSEFGVHTDGSSDYFLRTNGTSESIDCVAQSSSTTGLLSFTNTSGFYYTGEDTDRPENPNQSGGAFGSSANSAGVHFNDINVSAYTDVQIKCSFAARNDSPTAGTFEFGDGIKIYIDKTNNGTYELLAQFVIVETPSFAGNQYLSLDTDADGYGEGTVLTTAFQEFTFNVSGATTMDVRIELVSTGSNEEIAFDTFVVQGTPAVTLSAGDIAFTGYNSRDTDDFAFMATTSISAGTEIRFTDRGWMAAGAFRTGDGAEGELLYTVASGGLSAGEQVVIDVSGPTVSSGTGTIATVNSAMSFSTLGDQVLAFVGTSSSPTFIAGIQMNSGAWDADATANTSSSLPTGLTSGTTGFFLNPEVDGAIYNCSVTSGSGTALKNAIYNQSNWTTSNSSHLTLPCSASSIPSNAMVSITVFLEGAYNGSGLNTGINGNLPAQQPYNGINSHTESTNVTSMSVNVVDWVLVELREAASGAAALNSTKVGAAAGLLMNDGSIKATNGTSNLDISLSGNTGAAFYIVVYHRNHLPIMSANAISESGGTYSLDFTSSSTNTYQTTIALVTLSGGKFGMPAGDSSGDGNINTTDLETWRTNNGAVFSYSGTGVSDFNLDGEINAVDRNDFQQKNTSKTRQVPSN